MTTFITSTENRRVPRMDGSADVSMGIVVADDDACTGCNLCVETCPGSALTLTGKHQVRMISTDFAPCVSCGDCVAICQPGALSIERPHVYGGFFKTLHRGPMSLPRRF